MLYIHILYIYIWITPHTWNGSWRPRLRSSWAWSWRASDPVPRPRRRCHRGHRWNQRSTGEFWVENAGEKPRKMEKKQVSKGLKWIFQLIESKKIGEWKWIWTNLFLWIHHSFPNLWPKIPGTASAVSRKSHARNAWHPVGQNLWDPIPWYPKIVG